MKALRASIFKTFFLSLAIIANTHFAYAQTASILPNAKTTFNDQNGKPLSSGKVYFYEPGTTTPKATYQDIGQTISNTQPVSLDAAGRAKIWGTGQYRQQVYDKFNNLIWDADTASAGAGTGGTTIGDGLSVGTILPWSGIIAPSNYQFAYGQALSRTTFPELYSALTVQVIMTCTGGSPTISNLTDTSYISVGAVLESICVSGSPTVISKTSTTVTLSANATISTTSVSGRFFPYGNGDGLTTFNLPDTRGYVIAGRCNMGGVNCSVLNSTYFSTNSNNTPSGLNAKGGSQSHTQTLAEVPTGITSSGNIIVSTTPTTYANNYTNVQDATVSVSTPNSRVLAGSTAGMGFIISSGTNTMTSINTGGNAFSIIQPTLTLNYIIKTTPDVNLTSSYGVAAIGGMTGIIACGSNLSCVGNIINVSLSTSSFGVQNANTVLAGPTTGPAANPTFRTLASADLPALTGDVTSAGGGVTTIVNNIVSNTKLSQLAATTIKGNPTSSTANATDFTIQGLTNKPVPDTANDRLLLYDNSTGTLKNCTVAQCGGGGGGGVTSFNGATGPITLSILPQMRITLASGIAVMTSTVTAANTIYVTPTGGGYVPIYDGTNWTQTLFSEVSQLTTDTTKSPAATTTNSNYDIFCWNDAGTKRCTRGPAWSSNTARGTGAGTSELTTVNGILLNANAITNGPGAQRGTYMGTIRTNGTSTVDYIIGGGGSGGVAASLGVWNMYNRNSTTVSSIDSGVAYTYTSGTVRQARASAGNQVSAVWGLNVDNILVTYQTRIDTTATSAAFAGMGIGEDTTTAFTSPRVFVRSVAAVIMIGSPYTSLMKTPLLGYHTYSANEQGDGANANSFDQDAQATLSINLWN